MDHKDILQEAEDKGANKDSGYGCWKDPSWGKENKKMEK